MIYFFATAQDHTNASYHRGVLFEDLLRKYLAACGYQVEIQRRKTAELVRNFVFEAYHGK